MHFLNIYSMADIGNLNKGGENQDREVSLGRGRDMYV